MKLANYLRQDQVRVGIVSANMVFDLVDAVREQGLANFEGINSVDQLLSRSLLDLLKQQESEIVVSKGVPVESVKLLSPVLLPEKIFLVAVNYASHGKEQSVKPPSQPYFFTKFRNALIGPGEAILAPRISGKVDWEAELAVVIGKAGKYVPKQNAMDHVAGYTISNDISFRDQQFPPGWPEKLNPLGQNWVKGKSLDSAFPLGPWLVTKDEIPDPYSLGISLSVNGVTKQSSNTKEMLFKIDALIEYLSRGITLKPGDVISTGTPEGVAVFTGQPFLRDGDIVEANIDGIGTLRNPVVEEK